LILQPLAAEACNPVHRVLRNASTTGATRVNAMDDLPTIYRILAIVTARATLSYLVEYS
jgi:hypothetical protein